MTITQAHARRRAFRVQWVSWWATTAVVAFNLAVGFASTHPLADSSWLVTLLLGAFLAAVAPKEYLRGVQALISGGLLTVPAFFVLVFLLTPWMD